MSVCVFHSLSKDKYSNLFIVAAFSNVYFSGKISLPVKNSYLLTFSDDKAETFCQKQFVYLSPIELCFVRFCYRLFQFFTNSQFYKKFLLNRNALSNDKVVSFTKNEYGSLV